MSEKRKLSKRFLAITLVCLSLPVFYVLSIGPAAFAYQKFDPLKQSPFGKSLEVFYSPILNYIKDSDDFPAKLLLRYVELWIGPD